MSAVALRATIWSNCGTRTAGGERPDKLPELPRRVSIFAFAVAAVPSCSGRLARAAAPPAQPAATSSRNFSIAASELAVDVGVVGVRSVLTGAVSTAAALVIAGSDGAGTGDSTLASVVGSSPAQPTSSRAAVQLTAAR
jgi:hypothetical protein